MHPVLEAAFSELDRAQVRWCLLRRPESLTAPPGDVDLLVDRRDRDRLQPALERAGLVLVPVPDVAREMVFVGYDVPSDSWLVLELVTELSFGRHLRYPTRAEAGCLDRRQRQGPLVLLSTDDAFWSLVLHCLLEKSTLRAHHRQQLRDLGPAAVADGPLAQVVGRACPAGWDAPGVLRCIERGDWHRLERLGPQFKRSWRRRHPLEGARASGRWVLMLLQQPGVLVRRRGLAVALVGPNGVGKSTLARGLSDAFPLPSRVLYMGLWKERHGRSFRWLSPALAVLARPGRVWSLFLQAQYHQLQGRLVVYDRYVYDALLPPKPPLRRLKAVYFWLLAHACPAPDMVIGLEAPSAVAYARKGENSPAEQERERLAYAGLVGRVRRLLVVDATGSRAQVRAAVQSLLWQRYAARWAGRRRENSGGSG
ncbi:MAG: hypothetical protein ACR2J0_09600 [Mycobacteriales bacterium]